MEANEILHEIDPDGDIELILHNPNAPSAVWVQEQYKTARKSSSNSAESPEKKRKHSAAFGSNSDLFVSLDPAKIIMDLRPNSAHYSIAVRPIPPRQRDPAGNTRLNQGANHRFRLSSKHLTSASVYFKKMLKGPWKESNASTIEAHDWDPDAMVILMNVIHGRHRSVPKRVDIEKLANITVLVDYYDCQEVIEVFAERWTTNVEDEIPEEYCRQLVLWIAVGHMFSRADVFSKATKLAILYSKGPIQTLDLPIPQHVVDTIEQRRQVAVERIIADLHDLTLYFSDVRRKCSFECSWLLLGALKRQLQVHGLLNPRPTKPFIGYSAGGLLSEMDKFVSLKLSTVRASDLHRCNCELRTFTEGLTSVIRGDICGMELAA